MTRLTLREFRELITSIREPVEVTRSGDVIGVWTPAAGAGVGPTAEEHQRLTTAPQAVLDTGPATSAMAAFRPAPKPTPKPKPKRRTS